MNESQFYQSKVKPGLAAKNMSVSGVENTATSGVFDLCVGGKNQYSWIELKVAIGKYVYFRTYQIGWLAQQHKSNRDNDCFILAYNEKQETIALVQGRDLYENRERLEGTRDKQIRMLWDDFTELACVYVPIEDLAKALNYLNL